MLTALRSISVVYFTREIAVGATGWVASKVIHKAQGPLGHWINKKIGQDPIGDAAEEFAWMVKEGLDHFK